MTDMRLPWLTVLGAIGLAATSLATAADSFTSGVLSCAAESDRERRLECYDQAVASYTAALAHGKRDVTAGAASTAPAVTGAAPAPRLTAAQPSASASTAATSLGAASASSAAISPGATFASAAAPAAAASAPAAQVAPAVGATTADKPAVPRHVAARIASVEHFPDYVVVHLDNQQTWKQVSDSPGSPVLRNGDPVTIDREMGSYWLAGPKGEAVQVRLEEPKP